MAALARLVVLLAVLLPVTALAATENPIRKIVTFLQNLSKELEADAAKDKDLFEQYQCYCTKTSEQLSKTINDGKASVDSLSSEIEELKASSSQLDAEVKDLEADLTDNGQELEAASAVREKEASEFASENGEMKSTVEALAGAIPALEQGLGGGEAMMQLQQRLGSASFAEGSRSQSLVQAFLQQTAGGQLDGGEPGSSQILGVLKQMQDDFTADMAKALEEEKARVSDFEALSTAKKAEMASADSQKDDKKVRIADQRVRLAVATGDLTAAEKALASDEAFLAELTKTCAVKAKEYDARVKSRGDESEAISEVIKILNDDDSLELFKKTLTTAPTPTPPPVPGLALIQTRMRTRLRTRLGARALARLREGAALRGLHARDISVLAHRARQSLGKGKFDEVKKMVSTMADTLKEEQTDDNEHLQYCKLEIQKNEAEISRQTSVVDNLGKKLEELKSEIANTEQSIKELKAEIAESDKSMAEATASRKTAHALFLENMSQNTIANRLLEKAKGILAEVYLPPSGAAAMVQRQEGDDQPEEGIVPSFVQTRARASVLDQFLRLEAQEASSQPETATYEKKTAEGGGAVAMISQLISELKLSEQAQKKDEEEDQKDYEELAAAMAASTASKKQDIDAHMEEMARLSEESESATSEFADERKELASFGDKKAALHASCDFILGSYDVRRKARGEELDSLQASLAVLSGADGEGFGAEPSPAASFLQPL